MSEPLGFLIEPDPAILRAGLVQALGLQLGAAQLDPEIAYLTSTDWVELTFARAWRIDAWMPFSVKRLRAALRERKVGRVTVKREARPCSLKNYNVYYAFGAQKKKAAPSESLYSLNCAANRLSLFVLLIGKDGQMTQGYDMTPALLIPFCKDAGFRNNYCACFFHHLSHPV